MSPRRTARRALALIGATAIGTLAALTIPSAAQAHTVAITGKTDCANGKPIVTWTVRTDKVPEGVKGTIQESGFSLGPGNSSLETIKPGVTIQRNDSLQGVQTVTDSTAKKASLSLTIKWSDGYTAKASSNEIALATDCAPVPTATPSATHPPAAPQLPVTGASLTVPLIAGSIVLAAGAGLLFAVRRRGARAAAD
jgi:LPXTG-motif cell wall-anchored protein